MTPEQLAAARATHWRQDAQPLLTLEEATAWLERMQLALFLPRKSHVLAPAPSFVEAVLGQGNATPGLDAIQQAHALLVRMVIEGTAVPLNLFGTPGEQPDFLVATHALSHLAALQADRNWKKPPSRTGPGKVSPLAIEIWKLLEREGALTANEIRAQLGHELTEAATIRGLSELWQNLRVAPLPAADGEGAHWQLLTVTHKKQMAAAGTMAQTAALSVLVANYLQSVVTATGEDVEAFLSPVASRARIRDVVRGLTATRQLKSLSMDAQTFLFIDGTLPEMPEIAAVAGSDDGPAKPAFMGRSAYRERMLNKGKDEETQADEAAPSRASFRPGSDRAASDRPARRFAAGAPTAFRKPFVSGDRSSGPRKSFGGKTFGGPKRFGGDKPFAARDGRPPFRRDEHAGGAASDASRPPRSGFSKPGFSKPGFSKPGFDRPRPDRPGFDRPKFDRHKFDRPRFGQPRFGRPRFEQPGPDQTGSDRPAGEAGRSERPFRPRTTGSDGEKRPSFKPRATFSKPGVSKPGFSKPGFTKPGFGGRPPFRGKPSDRPGGDRPFRPRPEGDRPRRSEGSGTGRPFRPRENREAGPGDFSDKNRSRAGFQSRAGKNPGGGRQRPTAEGGRPFTPRPSGPRTDSPRTEGRPPRRFDGKPSFPKREGGDRPRGDRPRSDRPTSDRPRGDRPSGPGRGFVKRGGAFSGKPGGRPASGRPASGGARPPARGGRPGFGSKPGGRPSGPRSVPRSGVPGAGRATGHTPGRNPGGTGRPGGPRSASSRPSSSRPSSGRPSSARPSSARPGASRPGGMKPPTRKPRKEKDSE